MKKLLLAVLSLSVLTACGGGGGGSSTGSSGNSISGVASVGAPITDAEVVLLSSNGSYYTPSVRTGSDGKFQFNIDSSTYTAPYLMKITKQSGQSKGSYYAFVESSNAAGLLVTPISNATLGLAANSSLDEIFASGTIPSGLNASNISTALEKVYTAGRNGFSAVSISSSSSLLQNINYVANGEGQDAVLDMLNFHSASAVNGSVLIGSKLTGASVKVENGSSVGAITEIPFGANGASLLVEINNKINLVNNCIKTAVNSNSAAPTCVDDNYLGSGAAKSDFIDYVRYDFPTISSIGLSSIRWCTFDSSNLSFNSSASQLVNATGVCNASFDITLPNGSSYISEDYKFTLNSSGSGVSEVKVYGNQANDSFDISPKILVKRRVDGYTMNTGITSGYMFDIGTGLLEGNGNPTILSTSNLSAKVEILRANNSVIDTFYMQCVQGSGCINSRLAVCKNKSSTCASGYDTVADNVISVDSNLGDSIVSALAQGFVKARITTYNKILSDQTKSVNAVKVRPIVGLPISSEVASQLTPPSLTAASSTALANWTGQDSINLSLEQGDRRISLTTIRFSVAPSADVETENITINHQTTSVPFTGLSSGNNSQIVPLGNVGCSQMSGVDWRGIYIEGTFSNIPVEVKQFGSCYESNY